MMQGSAPGVVPEDVPCPFRPASVKISRAVVPVRSSSASVGGVLGSGRLTERWGTGSVLWAHVYLPKLSYSPYWDSLTYFG